VYSTKRLASYHFASPTYWTCQASGTSIHLEARPTVAGCVGLYGFFRCSPFSLCLFFLRILPFRTNLSLFPVPTREPRDASVFVSAHGRFRYRCGKRPLLPPFMEPIQVSFPPTPPCHASLKLEDMPYDIFLYQGFFLSSSELRHRKGFFPVLSLLE